MQKFKLLTSSNEKPKDTLGQTVQTVQTGPKSIKGVLEECYVVISDLKQQCKMLRSQLNKKDIIINKLLQEKQEHILHLSYCQTGILKQQLDEANKRSLQMKNHFESAISNYEKDISKYKSELERLKGFNKVLRIQNNQLREESKEQLVAWRQRQNKIGKITAFKLYEEEKGMSTNTFTLTKNKSSSIQQQQVNQVTPIKFKTSKSTSLSTAAKSNQYNSKELDRKQTIQPKSLFQNTLLKDQIHLNNQIVPHKSLLQSEEVSIWFSKLKKLLAESDQQN